MKWIHTSLPSTKFHQPLCYKILKIIYLRGKSRWGQRTDVFSKKGIAEIKFWFSPFGSLTTQQVWFCFLLCDFFHGSWCTHVSCQYPTSFFPPIQIRRITRRIGHFVQSKCPLNYFCFCWMLCLVGSAAKGIHKIKRDSRSKTGQSWNI